MSRPVRVPLPLAVREVVRARLTTRGAGHGFEHAAQVVTNARVIQAEVGGNLQIIECAAWLHDLGDAKFTGGQELSGELAEQILTGLKASKRIIRGVKHIVTSISYRQNTDPTKLSLEAQVVQDADRLEALGAHGLIRAIEFGAVHGRKFYDPNLPEEETVYGHFYAKLFTLAEAMNTEPARRLAKPREIFLREFLARYLREQSLEA